LKAPATLPNLDLQYGEPPPVDPDQITRHARVHRRPSRFWTSICRPSAGRSEVAGITSITGKGSYRAYDDFQLSPLDFYAKAPDQRTTIQHSPYGDMTITYDGKNAWMAAPATSGLSGRSVQRRKPGRRARRCHSRNFPDVCRQALTNWRVGPESSVDDQDVQIVQATTPSGFLVKLYFDYQDRPSAAVGAILGFAGGRSAGARRLFGLSGGFRCQSPVQARGHMDRWPDRFSAGFRAGEYGTDAPGSRSPTAAAAET
jgi:hypothetical protein